VDLDARSALEATIRSQFDAGDLDAAMTSAIEGYGPEIHGFLVGMARDRDHAADVFSAACERMWKALPRFRWDSSFRVWAYTIARNELLRASRAVARARQQVAVSQVPSVRLAVEHARTVTAPFLRTDVRDELARIRATLDPRDHELLTLRLDRRLSWLEIAQVLAEGEAARGAAGDEGDGDDAAPLDRAALTREAAALRKRFERLKDKLAAALRADAD
jgi:RNA polymerase sigma-70 factor (ECF subfamily)